MAGDFVAPDFRAGTTLALDYLVEKGHRHIGLLPSMRKTSAAQERVDAFRTALHQRGLSCGPIWPCAANRAAAAEAANRVLDDEKPPTALICHNDLMALGVLETVRRRGLLPGRGFGLVGFDDIPEASHTMPRLTTVATWPAEVGRAAATLLLRRIAAPGTPPERILIATSLIVRDT